MQAPEKKIALITQSLVQSRGQQFQAGPCLCSSDCHDNLIVPSHCSKSFAHRQCPHQSSEQNIGHEFPHCQAGRTPCQVGKKGIITIVASCSSEGPTIYSLCYLGQSKQRWHLGSQTGFPIPERCIFYKMPAESQFTVSLSSQLIAEYVQHLEMKMNQRRDKNTIRRNHNHAYRNVGTEVNSTRGPEEML